MKSNEKAQAIDKISKLTEAMGGGDNRPYLEHVSAKVADEDDFAEALRTNYDPVPKEVYQRIFNKYLEKGSVVLNVGAGAAVDLTGEVNHLNGALLSSSRYAGAHLISVEIDHDRAQTHASYKDVNNVDNLSVVEADGERLPFSDSSVQGVVSSNLINCPSFDMSHTLFDQAKNLLSEAWRVLAPGGFIMVSSFGYFFYGYDESGEPLYNDDIPKSDIVKLKDIHKMLKDIGFDDIREIDVDSERIEEFEAFSQARALEVGGFLAFKPKRR